MACGVRVNISILDPDIDTTALEPFIGENLTP
jgi:hypothetical protein